MSDKTCGTCGRGYPAVMCSAKYPVGAVMCHDESCDKWTERIDSVEQVALDMLNSYAEFTREQGAKYRDVARGAMVCNEFFDRLRALGIEVPND